MAERLLEQTLVEGGSDFLSQASGTEISADQARIDTVFQNLIERAGLEAPETFVEEFQTRTGE